MGLITDQIAEYQNSGSNDAFSLLVDRFKAELYAVVKHKIAKLTIGSVTATDIVQKTLNQARVKLITNRSEYIGMDSLWFRRFLINIASKKIGNELGRQNTQKRDASREESIGDIGEIGEQPHDIVMTRENALDYWEEAMREDSVIKGLINILGLALEMKGSQIKKLLDTLYPNDTRSLRSIQQDLANMRIRMHERFPNEK